MTFLSKLKYFLMSFEMLFVFAIEQQNSCQIQNHFTIVELLIRSHILFRSFSMCRREREEFNISYTCNCSSYSNGAEFNRNISHIITYALYLGWVCEIGWLAGKFRDDLCHATKRKFFNSNEMNWEWQRTKWIWDEQNSVSLLCVRKSIYPTISDLLELSSEKDLECSLNQNGYFSHLNASILEL